MDRKKFRFCISAFAVLLLCLGMWKGLRYLLIDDTDSYTRRRMREFYEQENIDILFMGTSHSYRGFNPKVIDSELGVNSFYLGSASQPIDVTYLLIQEAVENYNINHIYVDLSYNVADVQLTKITDLTATYAVTDYMKPSMKKYLFLLKKADASAYANTFLTARREWEGLFHLSDICSLIQKKMQKEYREYEDIPINNHVYVGKGFVTTEIEVQEGTYWYDDEKRKLDMEKIKSSEWADNIESIIDYCAERDIALTFVSVPISSYQMMKCGNYDEWIHYVKNTLAGSGTEYIDFNLMKENYWEDTSLYFYDDNHLNLQGATKFSELFCSYVQGEIAEEDLFYDSIQEKYQQLAPAYYGVVYEDINEEERKCSLVGNRISDSTFRVYIEDDKQEKICIQDWSQGNTFYVPADYRGNCYLEIKGLSDKQDTVEYTININK